MIATVDPASFVHVAACVVVPMAWGAAVHFLFASWHARQAARHRLPPAETAVEAEAEEPNVP